MIGPRQLVKSLRARQRERAAHRAVELRWRAHRPAAAPRTKTPVIVSLTSYAPRFGTLAPTIKSLLTQSLPPDAVHLWIGHADVASVPDEVRQFTAAGLEIHACEDFRSYTKFVHALRAYPQHRIAICDDDTWYRPHWLEQLAAPLPADQIACHRIHRIRLAGGRPIPYNEWEQESPARDASPLNFPTGVGGVLFRADQLHPDILDVATARTLCPTADDTWLYWMARRAGSTFVRVGKNDTLVTWNGSQHVALWRTNNVADLANDPQIAAMIDRFGPDAFTTDAKHRISWQ